MKLEPVLQLPTAWTGVAHRFAAHLFEGHLAVADMERMEAVGDAWHKKSPGPTVELVVIYPSDSRMSHEERVRMGELIKRWESSRRASATVILAEGMLGAVHRSVLTGLLFLAPPPHPTKVFSRVDDAVSWLLPHVNALSSSPQAKLDGRELGDGVEEFGRLFMARRR